MGASAETYSPGRSGNLREDGEECRSQCTMKTWPTEATKQDSQWLKRKAPGGHGSAPGHLYFIDVGLVLLWDLEEWEWVCFWLLCLPLSLFSSYLFALSSLHMRFIILSCCILFCLVWLLCLGDPLFSEKQRRGIGSIGEGRWVCQRSRRKGNYGWDVLYERRNYFIERKEERKC